jgi:ankyrin repeat protein
VTAKQPKRKDRPGVDRYGRSPLHVAVIEGQAEQCRALLRDGAPSDAQDDNGWSPLHFAVQQGSREIVDALLAAGADPNVRDSNGNTPLLTAVFNSRGRGDIIAALRAAGADPFACNNRAVSALSLARSIANFDVAQFFEDLP